MKDASSSQEQKQVMDEVEPGKQVKRSSSSLLRSSGIVGIMTLISRVLGLARDVVIANLFGATGSADAFFVAFKIPNFMRRLFAEGAFSQAFVPVLSEYRTHRSLKEVQVLVNQVAGTLGGILLVVTLLCVAASPLVTAIFAPGFYLHEGDKFDLASDMLRITFPYLLLISLTAFCGAILNSYEKFAIPAFTPVLLNITLIGSAYFLAPYLDEPVMSLAWGVLMAGALQLVFQLPFLAHIPLAAIIEFIHTATLLHDDVVDNSELRRGKDTANAKWGNAPSVLVGDFLYSRAFQVMVEIGSLPIMNVISNATNVIAEGEVLQLLNCRNPDTTEEAYMQVIIGKTAMLFEAATQAGAILAGASKEQEEALRLYGRHLGIAFQLIDDVMDYESTAEAMGKNVGDDLAEGKPTLPLIEAMRKADDEGRKLIRKAIREGGLDDLNPVMEIVRNTGAIEYTKQTAQQQADNAIAALSALPDTSFKETLVTLANIAANRNV